MLCFHSWTLLLSCALQALRFQSKQGHHEGKLLIIFDVLEVECDCPTLCIAVLLTLLILLLLCIGRFTSCKTQLPQADGCTAFA